MNTATTIRRLTIWRNYLTDVVKPLVKRKPHKWNMEIWADNQRPDLNCKTAACALGWACTIPKLRKAGLYLNEWFVPSVKGNLSTYDFFGITENEECSITLESSYPASRKITVSDVTKQLTALINTYKRGEGAGPEL